MLERYRNWVFDLDGTITVAQHDFDAIRAELGIPTGRLILEFLAELPPARAAVLHARLDAIELKIAASARPAPGAAALLEALRARGDRIGILTRNTCAGAIAALSACGLSALFARADILGREVVAPKPAPDGILRLQQNWGCGPDTCLMIGDFRLDLEAGRNAGVGTVHVSTGPSRWPELTDFHFTTLEALHVALERIGS